MAYGITGNDDSTELCIQIAEETHRGVSGLIRHLVLEEGKRIRDRRGKEFSFRDEVINNG